VEDSHLLCRAAKNLKLADSGVTENFQKLMCQNFSKLAYRTLLWRIKILLKHEGHFPLQKLFVEYISQCSDLKKFRLRLATH